MRTYPTEWRIKAPRNGKGDWVIVVTTVDELGRTRHEGKGKTYDEAQAATKEAVEAHNAERRANMAQMVRDYVELGQLSASFFNEEEG